MQEVDIGLAPDLGTVAYITKITGNLSLARELAYTARTFTAAEAEKLGLVSKVVDGGRDQVIREALELAKTIAAKSPVAVVGAKHLINHSRDHSCAFPLHLFVMAFDGLSLQGEGKSLVHCRMERCSVDDGRKSLLPIILSSFTMRF